MKNKFLFSFLFFFLLLLFCFSDFGVGLFCCEIFSHQTEIGDSKAGAELLDIILTKVHISLSLSLSVRGILLISIISFVCSDLWVILDVYFIVSEKFMLD